MAAAIGVWVLIFIRKPGFFVLNAVIVKTKNALPVLSLTLSFKGSQTSYLNPEIYIKSASGLYKATIFSGSNLFDNNESDRTKSGTPAEMKNEKILPYHLGVFTINVFYPTEIDKKNKTYLYVTKKMGKTKKFFLKYKMNWSL